jgi:serine/threonine protein kinase
VKPRNLAMGLEEKASIVHIIDFGLSKAYINPVTKKHISFSEKKKMIGTAYFVSVNIHMGYEKSRRDDLESLGYTLIYLAKGLTWKGLQAVDEKDLCKKISKQKSIIPIEELCKGLIEPFGDYLRYCKTLLFQDKPDYNYLKKLFRTHFLKLCPNNDFTFNWNYPIKDKSIKATHENDKEVLEEDKKVEVWNKITNGSGSKEISKAEENKEQGTNFINN